MRRSRRTRSVQPGLIGLGVLLVAGTMVTAVITA